jgi:hypothetical protein
MFHGGKRRGVPRRTVFNPLHPLRRPDSDPPTAPLTDPYPYPTLTDPYPALPWVRVGKGR